MEERDLKTAARVIADILTKSRTDLLTASEIERFNNLIHESFLKLFQDLYSKESDSSVRI